MGLKTVGLAVARCGKIGCFSNQVVQGNVLGLPVQYGRSKIVRKSTYNDVTQIQVWTTHDFWEFMDTYLTNKKQTNIYQWVE